MIVQFIMYAVLAAGLAWGGWQAWSGFKENIARPYVEEQVAKDAELVKAANGRAQAAQDRATSAEGDAKVAREAAQKQSDAVQGLVADAAKAQAAARKYSIQYTAELAKNKDRDAKLRAAAAAAPKGGQSCEALLSATDSILRESARVIQGEVK